MVKEFMADIMQDGHTANNSGKQGGAGERAGQHPTKTPALTRGNVPAQI